MLSVVRRSYYHRGEYRENCPGEVSGDRATAGRATLSEVSDRD